VNTEASNEPKILYHSPAVDVFEDNGIRSLYIDGYCQGRVRVNGTNYEVVTKAFTAILDHALKLSRKPARALVIGGGAYILPSALKRVLDCDSVVFEPNERTLAVAYSHFGLPTEGVITHQMKGEDAPDFLQFDSFDLIILDAFNGPNPVASLYNTEYVRKLRGLLKPGGTFAVNIISHDPGFCKDFVNDISKIFDAMTTLNVEPRQFVVLATILEDQ